jgi:hypothetical protein
MRFLQLMGGMALGSFLTVVAGGVMMVQWGGGGSASGRAVQVYVENRSGQEVHELHIKHSHGEIRHHLVQRNGETVVLSYPNSSESSYTLTATLADGKKLMGGAGYIEGGVTTRERLEPTRVVSSD